MEGKLRKFDQMYPNISVWDCITIAAHWLKPALRCGYLPQPQAEAWGYRCIADYRLKPGDIVAIADYRLKPGDIVAIADYRLKPGDIVALLTTG
jgi:hypothetical protein